MENIIVSVLIVFLSWSSLYILLCLLWSSRSYEWHVRIVTIIHAVLVTYLSWKCSYDYGPWPFTDLGGPNTDYQNVILTISLGYFLFDIIWCIYFKTEGPVMMFHHIVSISGLSVTLLKGMYGCEIVAVLFGTEITNPFLQIRWFLKDTGYYNTVYGEIVDLSFMGLFGTMRLGIGSYLLYTYMTNPNTDYLGRSGGLLIYCVSWIFWASIVQFAIRKYSKKWNEWKAAKPLVQDTSVKADTACDACQGTPSAACVQRVSKVIQGITKSTVDADTVEAICSLSTSNEDNAKRSNKN